MMKKFCAVAGLAIAVSSLSGCYGTAAFVPSGSPIGFIYSNTMTNHAVTANPVGAKSGEACAISIIGLVTIGDASATTAARAGGITKVGIVDQQDFNVLGIYSSHCTEVRGD
jgi:hypothetical protein